ncbi:MAG: DUF268 domain-containing protein [Armatimonadetes bacterium]|nr:DUF268 domain-containing protein [Armatimonadota bacterium]
MIYDILRRGKRTIILSLRKLRSWPITLAAWCRFWRKYFQYKRLAPRELSIKFLWPCIGDDTPSTEIEPIYFFQGAWAFEKIIESRPSKHVDVGSHHTFVALLSKVVPVTMVDIRPLQLSLDSLSFQEGSILDLPFEDASLESVSSICVIEHIGLGRYGDPLNPSGSSEAIQELKRVIRPGGHLYISVPIYDKTVTLFNAGRAFKESELFEMLQPLEVVERRYIYGEEFVGDIRSGFGTGCYHLLRGC